MDLEQRVQRMEDKLDEVTEVLKGMASQLESIKIGIYGDEKNRHSGLLDRQGGTDKSIEEIKLRIQQIEQKNVEQDIALKAKKTLWTQGLEVVKWIGLAYLVSKGIVGPDGLFNKLF